MSEQATILIVDDEITIRKTLGLALTSKGYKIVAAGNGPEALLLLEDNVIDLALLDMRMPGMSGYEVLKEIRKSHSALELPVLMLTATDDADAMISSLKSGANDYLIKPCNREILAARIETQLSMKEMNESLISERNNLRREFVDAKVKSELDSVKFKSEFDQRTQAEKALIESERRFKVLYDNTPAMCFNIDLKGEIQSVNRYGAFILGYQRDELIGRMISELYEESDREQARQYLQDVIRLNDTMHRWKLRKIDKHGNSIMMRETAKLVRNFVNEATILMVAVDVADEHTDLTL
jgi:PAS domain S-box-containing protein